MDSEASTLEGRKRPGRPRKQFTESVEATDQAYLDEQQSREKIRLEAKKTVRVIGYELKPYYFNPKKVGYCKLILVSKVEALGTVHRQLIGKNIRNEYADPLMRMSPDDAAAEHDRRNKLPNYGFPVKQKPR